ncbi:hypothetical protein ACWEO1_20430 [Kitasatospora cineracea]
MITITTTATLTTLRRRAAQAEQIEADLAETRSRLEHAAGELEAERQRDLAQETADLNRQLAAAQHRIGALELKAASNKALLDLTGKNAAAQIAGLEHTVGRLRGELEQARAGRPAGPELPEHTVRAFRTVGGGLVAQIARPDSSVDGHISHGYRCLACGDELIRAYHENNAHHRANEHAAQCRAIPTAATTRT